MAGEHGAFVEHCLELLAPLGPPRVRRMFGAQGLYVGELFVAVVSGERLYLKADAASAPRFAAAGGEALTYAAAGRVVKLGFWTAPAEALDSAQAMEPWARLAMAAALRSRTGSSRSAGPPSAGARRSRRSPRPRP